MSAEKRFKHADNDKVIDNVAAVTIAANINDAGDAIVTHHREETVNVADASQLVDEPIADASQLVDEAIADASQLMDEPIADASQLVDEAFADAIPIVDEAIAAIPIVHQVCPRCDTELTNNASLKVIGEICIKNNLPGGSPDWMAHYIGRFTTALRVRCPSARDEREMGDDDEVCIGGCTICCQVKTCARDACIGGCNNCAKSRTCESCKVLGCARCVDEHSNAQSARLLGALTVAALVEGNLEAAATYAFAGRRMSVIGHCDACRNNDDDEDDDE